MVEKRGRYSAADLEIVPLIPGEDKPAPPADLSEKEAEVWKSIVNAMPLRWFGCETWPVLRGLCKHVVLAEVISKQLDAAIAGEWRQDKVELLIDLYNRETRAVRQHSADLRLTKIARLGNQLNADRAVRNQALRRPWNE